MAYGVDTRVWKDEVSLFCLCCLAFMAAAAVCAAAGLPLPRLGHRLTPPSDSQLACLESIVDRLSLVVDPPSTLVDETGYAAPPLTTDQICEFLELLHPLLNRSPATPPKNSEHESHRCELPPSACPSDDSGASKVQP